MKENNKQDIFTIQLFDIQREEDVTPMPYNIDYYDVNEAIDAANSLADEYKKDDNVYQVHVFAGEYETKTGDVFGEPNVIYCATNVDKQTYAEAAKKMGYVRTKADYYAKKKYVFVLFSGDEWLSKDSLEILGIYSTFDNAISAVERDFNLKNLHDKWQQEDVDEDVDEDKYEPDPLKFVYQLQNNRQTSGFRDVDYGGYELNIMQIELDGTINL